ncbi:hypothetical protein JXB01_03745 [Candidatus Micrarchaeota archaeon]|nr:hypothetical protein [Candidatus Micrarchaeota archaeon]
MQDYGMKQTHGGGDDIEYEDEEEKKINLSKYLENSDYNLSGVLEKILLAYKKEQDIRKELEKLKHERMALFRIALRNIESGGEIEKKLRMGRTDIAYYSILVLLDMEWYDVFSKMVTETFKKEGHPPQIIVAMNKAFQKNKEKFIEFIEEMITDIDNEEVISLVSEMGNKDLVSSLKKELIFIARDDIGKNKSNAIHSLSLLCGDREVVETYKKILSGPLKEGKEDVLNSLMLCKKIDEELLNLLKEMVPKEKNAHLVSLMKRIIGKR